jgi:hypothetical protein
MRRTPPRTIPNNEYNHGFGGMRATEDPVLLLQAEGREQAEGLLKDHCRSSRRFYEACTPPACRACDRLPSHMLPSLRSAGAAWTFATQTSSTERRLPEKALGGGTRGRRAIDELTRPDCRRPVIPG